LSSLRIRYESVSEHCSAIAHRHLPHVSGRASRPRSASGCPAARACRTPAPGAPGGRAAGPASWAILSSSVKNSWNSSITSSERGIASSRPAFSSASRAAPIDCTPRSRNRSPRRLSSSSRRCRTESPNSRSLSIAIGPGVRQAPPGVGLELDALLEVDEVELELVGAVPQRARGDHDVQQGRLARARLAREQHVLARAPAQREVLQRVAPARPSGIRELAGARPRVHISASSSARACGTAPRPCPTRATPARPRRGGARRLGVRGRGLELSGSVSYASSRQTNRGPAPSPSPGQPRRLVLDHVAPAGRSPPA
jgi:hypothetical protein